MRGDLDRLAEMPRILEAALANATIDDLRARAQPESFCLIEHACHLRDLEREGYAVRLHRLLTERAPVLEPFHGDAVARQRDYMAQNPREAAAEFALARSQFIVRAQALTQEQAARRATFAGRAITIPDLVAMMLEHDQEHAREIAALVGLRAAA
jgi:hypothetical protein